MQMVPNVPKSPYNNIQFEEFVSVIGNRNLKNWTIVAGALGVSRKTISRWKKHPRAQHAIAQAIQSAIAKMDNAGKNDWRMYREKLKMLGISDNPELQHRIAKETSIGEILDNLEGTDYDRLSNQANESLLLITSSREALKSKSVAPIE